MGNCSAQTTFIGYISGAAPNTSVVRMEFIVNYEGLLDNQFRDYIPSTLPDEDYNPNLIQTHLRSLTTNNKDINKEKLIIENDKLNDSNINKQKLIETKKEITDLVNIATEKIKPAKRPGFFESILNNLGPLANVLQMIMPFGPKGFI